jgi:hypothetical protein
MISLVFRLMWRGLIFLLGVAALLFIATAFWPNNNGRTAIFVALLITYCLMAYIVIPNLMRLFHVFQKPDHIPVYVTTGDGWPSDPVNLAIVAKNRKQLAAAMKKAGWFESEPLTLKNGAREIASIIFNIPYPEAPLSNLYLFDRPHDIAFAIPTNKNSSARTRHHVRFWRLEEPPIKTRHSSHYDFWRDKFRNLLGVDREIWIGAATEDIRVIDIQWRTGQLTHGVSHEAEKERDFVIKTLGDKNLVRQVEISEPGEHLRFRGQSFRTFYTTDSSIKIARIK